MKIQMKSKTEKGLLFVLAGLTAVGSFVGTAPLEAHASTSSLPSVTVKDNGSVEYTGDLKKKKGGKAWSDLIEKYRFFIAGISGIAAVSMILFFIINFMKLGASSGNPSERSKAIMGLIFSGLAAAGLGAVTFIVGIFFNALS